MQIKLFPCHSKLFSGTGIKRRSTPPLQTITPPYNHVNCRSHAPCYWTHFHINEGSSLQCCNYCHSPSVFSSTFQSPTTLFHHNLVTREGRVLANGWTHPSSMMVFVHLFIRTVIRKVTIVTLNTICLECASGSSSWIAQFIGRGLCTVDGRPYQHHTFSLACAHLKWVLRGYVQLGWPTLIYQHYTLFWIIYYYIYQIQEHVSIVIAIWMDKQSCMFFVTRLGWPKLICMCLKWHLFTRST